MRLRLQRAWETVRASYWFLPSLMTLAAVGVAQGMIRVDEMLGPGVAPGWLYSGGPEGARAVLAVVAGSVMSTAGVTFSITIAVLTMASGQFGPRLLQNFMRDRGNQTVLGTFLATFIYSLLVLRTVRGGEEAGSFVPNASVTVGVLLGLASLGVLIYFIHHTAVTIQAPHVVAGVARDLHHHIGRIFPEHLGAAVPPGEAEALSVRALREGAVVPAPRDGYLQGVDEGELMDLCVAHDLVIRLEQRPGAFLTCDAPLVRIWPPERATEAVCRGVRRATVLGSQRTQTQDAEFALDQLVEVAVRALSPGINDPFTAIHCIDGLSGALCHLARRRLPAAARCGPDGRVRIVLRNPLTFTGMVDGAFNQIRQYGRGSTAVLARLMEALGRVAACVDDPGERAVLRTHAEMVRRAARESLPEPHDREVLEGRYREVLARLRGEGE